MPENRNEYRLRFDRVALRGEGTGRCRVELLFSFANQPVEVSQPCLTDRNGPLRAAVLATLKVVEDVTNGQVKCELEDLDQVSALGQNLIAVLVNLGFEGRTIQLFGSCRIDGDKIDAGVRATLNATNRFIELAMRG